MQTFSEHYKNEHALQIDGFTYNFTAMLSCHASKKSESLIAMDLNNVVEISENTNVLQEYQLSNLFFFPLTRFNANLTLF